MGQQPTKSFTCSFWPIRYQFSLHLRLNVVYVHAPASNQVCLLSQDSHCTEECHSIDIYHLSSIAGKNNRALHTITGSQCCVESRRLRRCCQPVGAGNTRCRWHRTAMSNFQANLVETARVLTSLSNLPHSFRLTMMAIRRMQRTWTRRPARWRRRRSLIDMHVSSIDLNLPTSSSNSEHLLVPAPDELDDESRMTKILFQRNPLHLSSSPRSKHARVPKQTAAVNCDQEMYRVYRTKRHV